MASSTSPESPRDEPPQPGTTPPSAPLAPTPDQTALVPIAVGDSNSPTPVLQSALAAHGKLSAASPELGVVGNADDGSEPDSPIAVVGLGASAGGIQVLGAILEGIPADSGLAFVVVMHLSPDFESSLAEVLQGRTVLQVSQVTDRVRVKPNCVYVIPPRRHIAMEDSHLLLTEQQDAPGQRVAIDLFFRTLAAAYGQRSVCAVLSGADSDGVIGLKHIKEQGGVTIAQDPDEAEHDSMPRAAIATAMVDWVLKAEEIAPRLIEFAHNERRMQLPPEDSASGDPVQVLPESEKPGGALSAAQVPSQEDEDAVLEVLAHLRARTRHDFAHYKRATVLRRIARRMQVNLLEDIPSYLAFLRATPKEVPALLDDLLINVTNFFRDPESFTVLPAHIPQLFAGKTAEDAVRVWVCGCATGEEAYSVAILLFEHASKLADPPAIQVFATDMDDEAIRVARQGLYPLTIEADVSGERLRRFFVPDQGRYRVRQEIRDLVLFATHDVLRDPPFSRLDMVTCRNLLIYLKREAQERVFDIFHFSLRAGGLLFLGNSENLNETHMLFAPLDKKHRLYVRRAMARPAWQIPALPIPAPLPRVSQARIQAGPSQDEADAPQIFAQVLEQGLTPSSAPSSLFSPSPTESRPRPELLLSALHLEALEEYAPPSLVVNENYDIVHLSEHVGRFLRVAGGVPSVNLLEMVHPDLRIELRTALFRAAQSGQPVVAPGVKATLEGTPRLIKLQVRPLRAGSAQGLILVVFTDITEQINAATNVSTDVPTDAAPGAPAQVLGAVHTINQGMDAELSQLRSHLNATVEQYEASTEELKASNEELPAMNEEMRSATEELQTSKEELQAVNEELSTVNNELKNKLDEVGRLNSDLQNLLTSTEIGTIFLDRGLNIKSFTPRAQDLFNLIATDLGRPLSDLTHKLEYSGFTQDAAQVLRTLAPIEREVHATGDGWFLARLLPYRTLDDRIDGVVLTFVDISARKKAEERVRLSEERLRLILESARDYAIFTNDLERRVSSWSAGAQAIFGYTEAEIVGQSGDILFVPEDREEGAPALEAETALGQGRAENERWHIRKDGTRFWASGLTRPLLDEGGKSIGYVKIMRDLTEQKQAQEAKAFLASIVESSEDSMITINFDGIITSWNKAAANLYGYPASEVLGRPLTMLTLPEDLQQILGNIDKIEHSRKVETFDTVRMRKGGREIHLEIVMSPVKDDDDNVIGISTVARDVSMRKEAEEALRESEEQFRRAIEDAPIPIIMHAEDGEVLQISRSWTELTGYTLQDVPTLDAWLSQAHGEGADEVRTHMQRLFQGTQRTLNVELSLLTRDEVQRYWSFSASSPGTLRDGRRFIVGMAIDITERKQAEDAVRASEERQKYLVRLGDAIRPLSDAVEITEAATRMAMDHFNADRCYYAEIEGGTVTIRRDARREGLLSIANTYSLSETPLFESVSQDGAPVVVRDVNTSNAIDDSVKHLCLSVGIPSYLSVPVFKDGQLVGNFCLAQSTTRDWTDFEIELARETAERTWAAVERARAEAQVLASEEKYRTLFDSIDEGFCLIELICDEQGETVDYRFLDVNQVFGRQTGLAGASGKRMMEIVPQPESAWLQMYGAVARTGEPARFEIFTEYNASWYQVYASRVGGADSRQVGIVFDDITGRKRRESSLAFLAEVSQDLVRLSNIDETMEALGEKIGTHFGASRCSFFEVNEAEDTVRCEHSWQRADGLSLEGTYRVAEWISDDSLQTLRGGEALVIRDAGADPRVDSESLVAFDIASFLVAPILRAEQLQFILCIYDSAPREWRDDEIELMRELIARIWTRLERARAEELLATSEERLRMAMRSATLMWWEITIATGEVHASDNYAQVLGLPPGSMPSDFRDAIARLMLPEDAPLFTQALEGTIRGEGDLVLEYRMVHPETNEVIWVEATGTLTGANGSSRVIGVARNITERKQAEQAVREASERLRIAVEAAQMGTWDWDITNDRVFWNERHFQLLGIEPTSEPMSSKEFTRRIYPDDRAWIAERLQHSIDTGTTFDAEFRIMRDDGEVRWIVGYGHVVENGLDGSPTRMSGVMSDMTDRRRIEEAVRESEERFRALISQGADMITVSDREGRIIYASPTTETVSGYTPEEFMALNPFELMHPDDRERCQEAFQVLVGTPGLSLDLQHRVRVKSGEWRWAEGTFTSLFDEPAIGGLVANVRDITKRKRAEEQVLESESRLRTLSDAVPQVIWTNDAQGVANYFNQRWFDYSGLSPEESFGPGWQAIVHPEDAPASKERWHRALEEGEVFGAEYRLRRHDGAYRWFIGRNVPLHDGEGRITGWFGSATDIEDLKSSEAALRETEEQFRLLVEGVKEYAMFLMDTERRIVHWNAGAERVFGWTREEVLGESGDIIFTLEDQEAGVPEQEAQVAVEAGSAPDVRWHRRKDGSLFWIEGINTSLRDDSGTLRGFAKVTRDATRERKAEEALMQAHEDLQRAHDELEAHVQARTTELRAEITRRRGLEHDREKLMRGIVAAQEEERKRLSRELHDQMGQTLTALMLSLKSLPMPEDAGLGRPTPSERLHSAQKLTAELADYAHHLAWELRPAVLDNIGLEPALRQYTMEWSQRNEVAADFVSHGFTSKDRLSPEHESTLYRVGQEALSNVARHAGASQVSVVLERHKDEVQVVIEDNGKGFDPEQSSNRLGIVGMRERLELVHGTLTIESTPGEGTVVYARVPLQQDPAAD